MPRCGADVTASVTVTVALRFEKVAAHFVAIDYVFDVDVVVARAHVAIAVTVACCFDAVRACDERCHTLGQP